MKKLFLVIVVFTTSLFTKAQIQKDNWMIGGQLANLNIKSPFQINISPQIGFFPQDNFAIGVKFELDINSVSGHTSTNWDIGAFTKYYINPNMDSVLKKGVFFGEAGVGVGGKNLNTGGTSTNGINLGIGGGYAYFISRNISLTTSLKLNATIGGGSATGKANLGLNIGFEIFLPNLKVKSTPEALEEDKVY